AKSCTKYSNRSDLVFLRESNQVFVARFGLHRFLVLPFSRLERPQAGPRLSLGATNPEVVDLARVSPIGGDWGCTSVALQLPRKETLVPIRHPRSYHPQRAPE